MSYIHHKSTGKTDPDLMKCEHTGCKVKNLRTAHVCQGKRLCSKHWLELRKQLAEKVV